jgi:hypothetical protein
MMALRVIWKRKEGCSKLAKKVVSQVQLEMGQIDLLFDSYADLLERAEKSVPDSYSFFVEWDELEKLVTPLQGVWAQTKKRTREISARLEF